MLKVLSRDSPPNVDVHWSLPNANSGIYLHAFMPHAALNMVLTSASGGQLPLWCKASRCNHVLGPAYSQRHTPNRDVIASLNDQHAYLWVVTEWVYSGVVLLAKGAVGDDSTQHTYKYT